MLDKRSEEKKRRNRPHLRLMRPKQLPTCGMVVVMKEKLDLLGAFSSKVRLQRRLTGSASLSSDVCRWLPCPQIEERQRTPLQVYLKVKRKAEQEGLWNCRLW